MSLLQDKDREAISQRLADMTGEVKLLFFTRELDCQNCRMAGMLLEELTALSDKLSLRTINSITESETAEGYGIDKVPAIVLLDSSGKDFGIRFFGIPSGYEFATLLEDILMVSSGDSGLDEPSLARLAELDHDIHLQVFVTPSCPYCPGAVRLAHQMAFASEKVTGDMVEATEFPQLSQKYMVQGVPKTIVNETTSFEGMQPVSRVLPKILEKVEG